MTPPALEDRLLALRTVHDLGEGRIPDPLLRELGDLLARADERRALSPEHTVVGLFGATGSGKSSLLNALVGSEVARANVRRPTTSEPLAVVWDPPGAAALLDWLDVRDRRTGLPPIDARADRLVLLDLPDVDSVEASHRAIAERLAAQVDALVWVVDPQKYADAVLHTDFIRRHARHGAVTIVVLNQVDLLPAAEVPRVVASLTEILKADGMPRPRVLATSTVTGEGVDALRTAIGELAGSQAAAAARLEADVAELVGRIPSPRTDGSRAAERVSSASERRLGAELATAAGAETVANAVAASYRKRSGQATGWPVVSWILRFRADPLARLGLRPPKRDRDRAPELHRTSMPAMNAGAQARVSLAVRSYADAAAGPFTERWRAAIRVAGSDAMEALPSELDLAIARTRLPIRGSWWWVPFGVLQWASILLALGGVLWLLGIALLPQVGLRAPEVPVVEGWPLTTLLILGGVLLGIVLGLAAAGIGALGGAARRRRARAAIRREVAAVARDRVIEPIAAEVARADRLEAALRAARA